jgi:hypothetical protein
MIKGMQAELKRVDPNNTRVFTEADLDVKTTEDTGQRYFIGVTFAPENVAPAALVPGTNEPNQTLVKTIDAAHMHGRLCDGMHYAVVGCDSDRRLMLNNAALYADTENARRWMPTMEEAAVAEPALGAGDML